MTAKASSYARYIRLRSGELILLREITPDDAQREYEFVRQLSPQSRYLRFLSHFSELTPEQVKRFTSPDPTREAALVALNASAVPVHQIAVGRFVPGSAPLRCELALVVADAWQDHGLGHELLAGLIELAPSRGYTEMEAFVLRENIRMLTLLREFHFCIESLPDDPGVIRTRRTIAANRTN